MYRKWWKIIFDFSILVWSGKPRRVEVEVGSTAQSIECNGNAFARERK